MDSQNEETDERFAHILKDARFRTLKKSDKKIKVDARFKSMFNSKEFTLKYSMDKRGRPVKRKNTEDMSQFYRLSSESEKDEDNENDDDGDDDDDDDDDGIKLIKPKVPDARGNDSFDDSSSSDSDESSEDEELDHNWGEMDKDVSQTEVSTRRIAVCNVNWDCINATDLFVLVNSFKPSDGTIISVKIYPSNFGIQRMKIEDERGPMTLICGESNRETQNDNDGDGDGDGDDENDPQTIEKMRRYQIERLKYFYAIVECDSPSTADALYKELDGMEYESSASILDLRYIPDDMTFDDVTPKSESYSMPDTTNYKPPQFITSALQQSHVKLTWDETDLTRIDKFKRAFNNPEAADDLQAYLASSSSDEESNGNFEILDNEIEKMKSDDKINKYKELLNSLQNDEMKDNDGNLEMEITWRPEMREEVQSFVQKKENEKNISEFESNYLKKKEKHKQLKHFEKEKDINDDDDDDDSHNEIVNLNAKTKKNSKNKKKKNVHFKDDNDNESANADLELLLMDSSDDRRKHFNYKQLIDGKQKSLDDDFEFNPEDERFSAIYTSHHYNIDQSDPHFKKTKVFDEIVKRNKRINDNPQQDNSTGIRTKSMSEDSNVNLKSLIQSVKSKTRNTSKRIKFN